MPEEQQQDEKTDINQPYTDSELVIGLVGTVGTEIDHVFDLISERLGNFGYSTTKIKISSQIISQLQGVEDIDDNYARIDRLMTEGNELRKKYSDNGFLALSVAARINQLRQEESHDGQAAPLGRRAFVISSLKHPEEVHQLRKIYSNGFFLIGIHADETRRLRYLTETKMISENNAKKLIDRDEDESHDYGQHTRDTFHLSDFFVDFDGDNDCLRNSLSRTLDLIFGKPYVTPTFDEYAMFMAFSASLRSADLSRQVGAVVSKDHNIVSTGANDVPKSGGGLYWPEFDKVQKKIVDIPSGRDYTKGCDSNIKEKNIIIEDIISRLPGGIDKDAVENCLLDSKLKDITEYGRVVHAEMEAILACARNNVSTQDSTIYCTTFPCHNCAKHIIAAGIKRVVYVEPYPKSKAFEFHSDSITQDLKADNKVQFHPFVGVGPRSFFNLFSISLGSGYHIKRKKKDGSTVDWDENSASLRMQMLPTSYLERETAATTVVRRYMEEEADEQA